MRRRCCLKLIHIWQLIGAGLRDGRCAMPEPSAEISPTARRLGDTPPVLIALGARLVLRRGAVRRELPLEAFFLEYGKQDRAKGELVEAVIVPGTAAGGQYLAAYKISKRRDEDISSVAAGGFR